MVACDEAITEIQVGRTTKWDREMKDVSNSEMRYAQDEMILPRGFAGTPQINAAVAAVEGEFSPWVRYIRYDVAMDWSQQWAIFFRVVVSDEAGKHRLREITTQVVWRLTARLDLPNLGLLPYFDFRSESEQAALNQPEWAATM
jgi:hypothetical protein